MNLPPLPLIGGALFVDNSGWMEGISTCHRYLEYRGLRLRIPTAEKPSLNFGSAIHLALEYRYKRYQNKQVDDAYYEAVAKILTKFFEEHPPHNDDWRNLNWAMLVLRKYNQRYPIENFNLLSDDKGVMVERTFAVPLFIWRGELPKESGGKIIFQLLDQIGNDPYKELEIVDIPVIYTGRIDLPVSIDDGVHIMDHKTLSAWHFGPALGSKSFFDEMRRSAQQRGYCWAFEQTTGLKVKGYYVNGIRSTEPPIYVLENKTSSRANREGKKKSASEWWEESFQREHFDWTPWKAEEWKNNTIDLVCEFMWHYQRGYMPQKTQWCAAYGKCPYYEVCQVAPEDRGIYLSSGLFTDNVWTPLKTPTQSKQ